MQRIIGLVQNVSDIFHVDEDDFTRALLGMREALPFYARWRKRQRTMFKLIEDHGANSEQLQQQARATIARGLQLLGETDSDNLQEYQYITNGSSQALNAILRISCSRAPLHQDQEQQQFGSHASDNIFDIFNDSDSDSDP